MIVLAVFLALFGVAYFFFGFGAVFAGLLGALIAVLVKFLIWYRRRHAAHQSGNYARLQNYKSGAVYLAESSSKQYMKIGFTSKDAKHRERTLNQHREGGVSDWRITAYTKDPLAGRVETVVHKQLNALRVPSSELVERRYKRTGNKSKEIYELDSKSAIAAIGRARSNVWRPIVLFIGVSFLCFLIIWKLMELFFG